MDAEAETPIGRLRRELEEKSEDLRSWKIRCLQAEAEVRALKNRTRHAEPANVAAAAAVDRQVSPWAVGDGVPRNSPTWSSPRPSVLDEESKDVGSLVSTERRPSARSGSCEGRPSLRRSWGCDRNNESPARAEATTDQALELARLREEVACLKAAKENGPEASGPAVTPVPTPASAIVASPKTDPETNVGLTEVHELRQQISQKNFTIVQLQADMGREIQQLERQRKDVEMRNIINLEELREMTRRAESLSEQVQKSKRKATELQSAQAEVTKLHSDIEECEARLMEQASALDSLAQARDEAHLELAGTRKESAEAGGELRAEVEEHSEELERLRRRTWTCDTENDTLEARIRASTLEACEFREEHAAALRKLEDARDDSVEFSTDDIAEVGGLQTKPRRAVFTDGRIRRTIQCVASLSQLHAELQKELGRASTVLSVVSPEGENRVADGAAATAVATSSCSDGAASDWLLAQMTGHLQRAQQLLAGRLSVAPDYSSSSRAALLRAQVSSPEGEHPPPEERRIIQRLGVDLNDTLKEELNDYKIAAEVIREELTAEHCDDLDELLRRHDAERRSLHGEIGELRAKCTRAEASGAGVGLMAEVQEHFEQQLSSLKGELFAQFSDLHEQQKQHRGDDDRDIGRLQESLEKYQSELAASREDFTMLATLFDKERRENILLQDLNQHAVLQAASRGPGSLPGQAAATADSSQQMTPENTETWDSLDSPERDRSAAGHPATERISVGTPHVPHDHGQVAIVPLKPSPRSGVVTPSAMRTGAPPPSASSSRPSSSGAARASPAPSPPTTLRRGGAGSGSGTLPTPRGVTPRGTPHGAAPPPAAGPAYNAAVAAAAAVAGAQRKTSQSNPPYFGAREVSTI